MRPFLSFAALMIGPALLAGCDRHPLLGAWAFSNLEQAWEIQDQGKLTVSNGYEDTTCTDGGQSTAVLACHNQRKWAKAGTLTQGEAEMETYQFVVYKVSANTLNGRLESCRCMANPLIYYGFLEEEDLLLYNSTESDRTLIDRGKFQGSPD